MKIIIKVVALSVFLYFNSTFAGGNIEVVPVSKVIWEQLNPHG